MICGAGGKGGEITLKGLDNIRVICDSKDEKNGKDGIPGEGMTRVKDSTRY